MTTQLLQAVADLAEQVKLLRAEFRASTEDRFIGISELERLLGVDRVTIWRWYGSDKFPVPAHFGTRRTWRLSEVQAWIATRETKL